jgi:uncharacterized lipoprotein NlpE involved in copper resistance
MKKSLLVFLLSAVFALTGCDNSKESSEGVEETPAVEVEKEAPAADATQEEAPAADATQEEAPAADATQEEPDDNK